MDVLIGAVIIWIVPIFVANAQGRGKNRMGWLYGLCLGWLGVLILAVLPPIPYADEPDLADEVSALREEIAELRKAQKTH